MKKLMIRALLQWTLIVAPLFSFAQFPCGTEDPKTAIRFSSDELEREGQNLNNGARLLTRNFMIAVHVIRSSNGTSGISNTAVIDAIETMNAQYAPAKIKFELCGGIRYIDNNAYLETTSSEAQILVSNYNVPNVINIYFIPKVFNSSGTQICGNATLPSGDIKSRRILMANSCAINGSTLSHEMGHFFGLLHTHSTTGGIEYVKRINCSDRGDGFCDTPADPELGESNVSNCKYIGSDKDPLGDTYLADPSNFMSYAPKSCRTNFSGQQLAFISLIANNENSYIDQSCENIDFILTSNDPEDIQLDDFSTFKINFNIAINKPDRLREVSYEVSVLNSLSKVKSVIDSDMVTIPAGITYIDQTLNIDVTNEIINAGTLNVKIDSKDLFAEIDETNNTLTYNIIHEYTQDRSAILFPNPTSDLLTFYISNDIKNKLKTSVVDLSGKLVMQTTIDKEEKHHIATIDVTALSQGMYFLVVELDKKTLDVQKFVKL